MVMRLAGAAVRASLLVGVAVSDPGLRGGALAGPEIGEVQNETQHETAVAVTSEPPQEIAEELGEVHVETLAIAWGWNTWTIVADTSRSGWAWDVLRVKFLTPTGEELSPSTSGCHVVESGHADVPGYGPQNVFVDDVSWWGGRKDRATGKFYLGIGCSSDRQVAAVQVKQKSGDHTVTQIHVFHNNHILKTEWVSAGWLQTVWAAPAPVFTMLEERHFWPGFENCFMNAQGANSNLPVDNSHYTIEAWVMPDSNVGNGSIVSYGDWTTGRYQAFGFNGGASGLHASWWRRDLGAGGLRNLVDGQWHHVATTWDGQTRRILVDFVEVARREMTGFNVARTDNFCVGSSNAGSEPFYGKMKGIKIWRVARSGVQMSSD